MTKFCFITKKKTIFGNKISHSNRKTKRKFIPNIQKTKIWNSEKKMFIKLKISMKGLKIINKIGLNRTLKRYLNEKKK